MGRREAPGLRKNVGVAYGCLCVTRSLKPQEPERGTVHMGSQKTQRLLSTSGPPETLPVAIERAIRTQKLLELSCQGVMTLGCGGARGPDCHQERREEGTLSSPSGDQCRGITTRAGPCPGLHCAMEFGPWSSPRREEDELASQRSERRSQETKDLAPGHGSRLTEPDL